MAHPEGLQLSNERGEQRGYVDPMPASGGSRLEDLWIMQGSVCDLKCKHCYTASSPQNNRLQQVTPAELRPHIEEAKQLGVRTIYFTGGEAFVNDDVLRRRSTRNDDFLDNLGMALEVARVEVLTNGRRHIRDHFEALRELREQYPDRLTLRITLESTSPAVHDALRGRGTFDQTVETIVMLARMGFRVVVTGEREFVGDGTDDTIRDAYQSLFARHGVIVAVNLIENVLEMGFQLVSLTAAGKTPRPETFVTTNCFAILKKQPETLMCHFSRCIQKIDGQIRVYPCPVIYDDPRFELGTTLTDSLRRVHVAHKNCYDYCLKGRGASCRTREI
jgi:MoaA/NifB/PqqE/SkfB family radical SAM enzyme